MPDDKNMSFARPKFGDIERDLDVLKRSKSVSVSSDELQTSIDSLSRNIEQMMKVFKLAVDEIKLEEHDEDTVSKRLEPIMAKLNELTQQNEKIADGVVAVADMLKEHMDKEMNEFRTVENRIGQISMPPPIPRPSAPPGPPDLLNMPFNDMPPMSAGGMSSMPPMPPQMDFGMGALGAPQQKQSEKKKGFLSFGK